MPTAEISLPLVQISPNAEHLSMTAAVWRGHCKDYIAPALEAEDNPAEKDFSIEERWRNTVSQNMKNKKNSSAPQ